MATVYVPQIPRRRDKETNVFVPTINVSPAEEHGEIKIMLPPDASFYATADLVSQLRAMLRDYDYEAGDSVVAVGDPSIMAAVFGLLGAMSGKFYILKWDRSLHRYNKTKIVVQ